MIYAIRACSLGFVLVAQSEVGLSAVLMGDSTEELVVALRERFRGVVMSQVDVELQEVMSAVMGLMDASCKEFDHPLDLRGTVFQERVWQALRKIPLGETVSYSELAMLIGLPRAARAVAQACGANPLAVVVPCHRVVRRDGGLSGYRWGSERKRVLLERELK